MVYRVYRRSSHYPRHIATSVHKGTSECKCWTSLARRYHNQFALFLLCLYSQQCLRQAEQKWSISACLTECGRVKTTLTTASPVSWALFAIWTSSGLSKTLPRWNASWQPLKNPVCEMDLREQHESRDTWWWEGAAGPFCAATRVTGHNGDHNPPFSLQQLVVSQFH